jgi:3-methyladenine DNA glycosylase AlkC
MHPIDRFRAPSSIQRGTPLKSLLGRTLVSLIGESLATVAPGFAQEAFITQATAGLARLELMPRAQHIAAAMAAHLPPDPAEASRLLVASLGPELTVHAGMGLKPFFYLPHSACIAKHLLGDWEAGMQANRAITTRFTAEFCLRPYLEREPERTLARLAEWARDPSPHVRRLVSEGTRPRLPWAGRLAAFIRDPTPVLPLLDALVDDPELYVRRSVANHVGDIAKDHPSLAFTICRRWLEQSTPSRRQVVRHAVRHPARQGVVAAVALRRRAGGR